jgi:hypothetical protein
VQVVALLAVQLSVVAPLLAIVDRAALLHRAYRPGLWVLVLDNAALDLLAPGQ